MRRLRPAGAVSRHGRPPLTRLLRDYENLGVILDAPDRARQLVVEQRSFVADVEAAAKKRPLGLSRDSLGYLDVTLHSPARRPEGGP
ncbi:hypothetical protein AB0H63_04985 [Micromonospora echinospora]|uniref:hypothetical protein n=1 Tax=Micromonospora echinospora TaxID=1877 RepID=UPI0033F87480